MKTMRVILLITGILVAGLAFNTSFAQSSSANDLVYESDTRKEKLKAKSKIQDSECTRVIWHQAKAEKIKVDNTQKALRKARVKPKIKQKSVLARE
jgi:hypothetical protein